MRKTKKYYQNIVNRGLLSALAILPEIVSHYGKNPRGCRGRKEIFVDTEMGWNHRITGFSFYKKELYIDVYWQGDDTDGDASVKIIPGKTSYRIPAKHYDDGYRTRTVHSDINIDSEELYNAIKAAVK
jgi:hypothetical protein